jgi:hypothetical protein
MADTINPVYAGDTQPVAFNLTNRDGSEFDLTGLTLTVKKQMTTPPYTSTQLSGTITIVSATAGSITYAPVPTDFTQGTVKLWFIINNNGVIQHADPYELDILPAP